MSANSTVVHVEVVEVLLIASATTFLVHAIGVVVVANWFRPRLARVLQWGFFSYAMFVAMTFPVLLLASILLALTASLAGFAVLPAVLGFHALVALYFGGAGLWVGIASLWNDPVGREPAV